MFNKELKVRTFALSLFMFGIIAGRCLPQWEELKHTTLGSIFMCMIMFIMAVLIITHHKKIMGIEYKD